MKHKSKFGYLRTLILFLFCLSSCEKVIDIPLRDADPLLVIEGNIDNLGIVSEVLLSESTPFSFSGEKIPVSGATVSIQEGSGSPMSLTEHEPGRYILTNFQGKPGSTYLLNVSVDGKEYDAKSTMPQPVALDSIGTISTTVFSETIKSVAVIYHDPQDEINYYRFKVSIDQVENGTYWVFNDRFTNGNVVTHTLSDLSNKLSTGDLVTVQMQSIDSDVYRYWNSLRNQNPGASVPANPASNISNGALGYFSAHTISQTNFQVR